MGKSKAKQKSVIEVKDTSVSNPVPESFRSFIRVSEDEQTVFLTHSMPRYYHCVVREKIQNRDAHVSVDLDLAKVFGPTRLRAIFERGLKKHLIDGARGEYQKKDADGIVQKIKLTFEEAWADAIATMENNVMWLYGLREKQDYTPNSVDPKTASCVDQLVAWAITNCTTDTNKRYTKTSLPKFVSKAKNIEEFRAAAEQLGATEKRIVMWENRADAVCAITAAVEDEDIDVTV